MIRALEILGEDVAHEEDLAEVFYAKHFLLGDCEGLGCTDCVFNLECCCVSVVLAMAQRGARAEREDDGRVVKGGLRTIPHGRLGCTGSISDSFDLYLRQSPDFFDQ